MDPVTERKDGWLKSATKNMKSFSIVLHSHLPGAIPNIFLNGLGAASPLTISDPTRARKNNCLVYMISE